MNSYAIWCEDHGTDFDVEKYYLMAIKHGNINALCNYARWCEKYDTSFGDDDKSSSTKRSSPARGTKEDVQKYYLMAIDHEDSDAMLHYARWCKVHGTKEDVQRYYLMAINYDNSSAMNNYAIWCEKHGTKEDVKKYYLMAISHDNSSAMNNYAIWCEDNGTDEDVQKYYLMAIEHDHITAIHNYAIWCHDHNDLSYKKYFILGCKNNHSECKTFINDHFILLFLNDMNDVYDYLTIENKKIVNELLINAHRITNINIMNQSLCLVCQSHTKCLFLPCGHPQCFGCWGIKCPICND